MSREAALAAKGIVKDVSGHGPAVLVRKDRLLELRIVPAELEHVLGELKNRGKLFCDKEGRATMQVKISTKPKSERLRYVCFKVSEII